MASIKKEVKTNEILKIEILKIEHETDPHFMF